MAKYRIPVLENYEFQPAIKDRDLITPPESPAKGDRFIVKSEATGDWLGKENNIAWFDGLVWQFDIPKEGTLTYIADEHIFYKYNGSEWKLLFEELGLGDMLKSVYDNDEDGIVDKAESLDDGAGNISSAVDVKDAVDKKHTHINKVTIDAIEEAFTTALKTAYDDAVTKKHIQNTDTKLDEGGENEVSAEQVKGAITDSHTHTNKAIIDATEVALTSTLKSNYDIAYTRRAQYDSDLGMITFEI
jgi:hypothetical protein